MNKNPAAVKASGFYFVENVSRHVRLGVLLHVIPFILFLQFIHPFFPFHIAAQHKGNDTDAYTSTGVNQGSYSFPCISEIIWLPASSEPPNSALRSANKGTMAIKTAMTSNIITVFVFLLILYSPFTGFRSYLPGNRMYS